MKIEERNQNLSDIGFDAYMRKLIEEIVVKEVDNRLLNIMRKIAEEKAIENQTLTAKDILVRVI